MASQAKQMDKRQLKSAVKTIITDALDSAVKGTKSQKDIQATKQKFLNALSRGLDKIDVDHVTVRKVPAAKTKTKPISGKRNVARKTPSGNRRKQVASKS